VLCGWTPVVARARVRQAPQNAQNADALRQLFEAVRRICRIYLSLNFQEHPDFFAAKTNEFWSTFLELLKYENPLLVDADDEDVPGVLDRVKAAIGDIACLFAEKYEEDFRAFVAPFVTQVRAGLQQEAYGFHTSTREFSN
jgi:hypothetical protein